MERKTETAAQIAAKAKNEIIDGRANNVEIDKEELKIRRGRPPGSVAKTKKEKKDIKKVKLKEGEKKIGNEIKKIKKKKEGVYKYINLTQDMLRDLDEISLSMADAFQENTDGYITKAEIVAGSPFRHYIEHDLLEDKHVVFLYFFKKCFGNLSRACDKMGVSRRTVAYWTEFNAIFRGIMEDFKEGFLDDTEEKLRELIEDKNVNAIMFYLKTKGKDRGFTEKNILQVEDKTEVIGFEFVNVNEQDYLEADLVDNNLLEHKK